MKNKAEIPFVVRVGSADVGGWKRTGDRYISGALEVSVSLDEYECGVTRQRTTVRNNGGEPVLLSGVSSALIRTERGDIFVDRNRWQAEGQWNRFTPEQCGLVPASCHPWERETFVIDSVGSWSTGVFYPLTMISDGKHTYFMEIEGAHNWRFTHAVTRGNEESIWTLEGTAAHEENGGWTYLLAPGESYTTEPAVYGRVDGGFEEAAQVLVRYKRETSLTRFDNGTVPVVFNDYMNCLWGVPSDKKLLPLIDAAAEAGCEYFCIDAGWHKNAGGRLGAAGDWIVANERFGEKGLQGIFDHMKEKGLVPGVWFEFDTVNPDAGCISELGEDCLLERYGKPIPRYFFNFRNEKVRAFLLSRIDELYNMGVRYIKNDYNQTTGIGCDNGGVSPAEGLILNHKAFSAFIDDAIEKHPGLVIENCGSGACRADHGTLKHFYLQSTSDQEYYYNYPSIITGSAPQYAPEKAGIWSYPYPVSYDERNDDIDVPAFRERFADGEETIFNMVNGLCGALYQSGRLDLMDEKNMALVKEGVSAFKRMRADMSCAVPMLPTGTALIGQKGIISYGLLCEGGKKAYLAVWRVGDDREEAEIDLKKYGFTKVSPWYPSSTDCTLDGGILKVRLPKEYSARMVILE